MTITHGVVNHELVRKSVAQLERRLPNAKMVLYRVGQDWTGEWALFLGVVLANDAIRRNRLETLVKEVTTAATAYLDSKNLGLQIYFSFRSESEQRSRDVESWL